MVRMLPVLLDIRRARQRRWTLVSLAGAAVSLPFAARWFPQGIPLLGRPSALLVALAVATLLVALAAAVWVGRNVHWTLADDLAWGLGLLSFAVMAGLATAPVPLGALLFAVAALALGVRVPPPRLVAVTIGCVLLPPLVRVVAGASVAAAVPLIFLGLVTLLGHVTLARATHSLAYVLAEREALRAERAAAAATPPPVPAPARRQPAPALVLRSPRREPEPEPELDAPAWEPELESADASWDGLVDRIRSTLESLCEPTGVVTRVHAELQGLAPPSDRFRSQLLRIMQEAANHALRDTAAKSIAITLRRGPGGLVLEVRDDGDVGEGVRMRRGLAPLKGRVAPLGGSAELKHGDDGWVVRVQLPCEQLN